LPLHRPDPARVPIITVLYVATLDDAAAMCAALPDVVERRRQTHHAGEKHGLRTWFVGRKSFAWERPFSKAEIKRFGSESPPGGTIFVVRVADLREKEAVLQAHAGPVFTIPHFDGYAAVLLQVSKTPKRVLRELIVDAWLCTALPPAAEAFLEAERRTSRTRRSRSEAGAP
jgi:hypothetical protein